jgi:competence protein ComEC
MNDPMYSFSVLDVGQGSLQLFEEAGGPTVVFDCNLKGAREFVLRYFGRRKIKKINLLVLTGTDEDHADADGLRMLANRYPIQYVWIPDFPKDSENWKEFLKVLGELESSGTKVEKPLAGHEVLLGKTGLKVLSPHPEDSTSSNNASVVVKLNAGEVAILVPGDCEDERWASIERFFSEWLPSHILVAPHHGSDHGCVESVVAAIAPDYTCISVGKDNAYGHPDREALRIYKKYTKQRVFQTKDDGSILFEMDGQKITSVVDHAGQDPEGVKQDERAIAAALSAGAAVYVRPSGEPALTPRGGHAYPPTHYHGGDKPEETAEGGD